MRKPINKILGLFILITLSYSSQAQQYNSLLWKISKSDSKNVSYLFGTIHFYDTSVFTIPDTIYTLIKKSKEVAFELDLGATPSIPANLFIEDSSKTVKDYISDSSFQKLRQIINDNIMLKLFGDKIFRMKPILVGSFIGLPSGANSNSIDMELYNFSKNIGKQVIGLETANEQIESLNKLSYEEQGHYLEKAINSFSTLNNDWTEMLRIYKEQQADSLMEKIDENDASGSFNKELVIKRNQRLIERTLPSLAKTSLFIAVGAAHLPGKEGMIEILKSKGYQVKPLKLVFKKRGKK